MLKFAVVVALASTLPAVQMVAATRLEAGVADDADLSGWSVLMRGLTDGAAEGPPRLGRLLCAGQEYGVGDEAAAAAALLSGRGIRLAPRSLAGGRAEARKVHGTHSVSSLVGKEMATPRAA